MTNQPVIALLTDFGTADAYVGMMKGVIAGICPAAQCIDLTHAIAPQNVRQAAYLLSTAYAYFPPHTIFLVIVDPGVGTVRRPLAWQTDHGTYVAPDNGVLSYVLARVSVRQAVVLSEPRYQLAQPSHTFHGRDIFSPVAAHLAAGVPIAALGPAIDSWQTLPPPRLEIAPPEIHGEVLHIDHFGNLITSIGAWRWLDGGTLQLEPAFGSADSRLWGPIQAAACQITLGAHTLTGIHSTYAAVPPGALIALVGSSGQLEIGVNQGHAAQRLQAHPGDPLMLRCAALGKQE